MSWFFFLGTAKTKEGVMLQNTFRNNIDEELTVVRKTERDKETLILLLSLGV